MSRNFEKRDVSPSKITRTMGEVSNYSQANVENIKYVLSNFNWRKAFENISVDRKVKHLNETLLNIFRNCNLNKKIKCDYPQPSH